MRKARCTWLALAVVSLAATLSAPLHAAEPPTRGGAGYLPVGLAVDPAGNGVLDLNENAVVAPSWANFCNCQSGIVGMASGFTGPTGPVYTITDSMANYGTVGPFSSASCTDTGDCFGVTVTTAARPLTHWDSTMVEFVFLNTKTWTLHVGNSFTDVPATSGFYRFVETILHRNVTGGCGTDTYCPSASTTRAQMAVFVLVAREPAGFTPPSCVAGAEAFSDMPASSPFCKWVEELFRRGVVSGCGNGAYCADTPATRDAMAVFVLRTLLSTLNPPDCVAGAEMFADVPASNGFCKWIEELVRRGVVSGCGGGNYCPVEAVTREQMAVFLTVTFGLTLYGV